MKLLGGSFKPTKYWQILEQVVKHRYVNMTVSFNQAVHNTFEIN